jgi:23S rRNA (adenine2503-C2)-methyltransferase
LLAQSPDTLHATLCSALDESLPRYRATQIINWIYRDHVFDFESMTNLSKTLRGRLQAEASVLQSRIVARSQSRDGTQKLLLQWVDEATTECVMIPSGQRRTACVSTQVGCPVACAFCASGLDGLDRNLSAAEIVEQAARLIQACGPLTNVVFMGLGEPLANYEATLAAVRCMNAEWGLGIGARRMTISTVGLPSQMRRLADEGLQVTLALSLHAPTEALRQDLIPWARRVSLPELIDACRYYYDKTHREVTLEYIMLDGVNNTPGHAGQLADLTRRMRSNVNLIPYNPVEGLPYQRPSDDDVETFCAALVQSGVNVHVRHSRGLDRDAACGQLRRRHADPQSQQVQIGFDATNQRP